MAAEKTTSFSLQLQPRDVALLRGLFESRVMTANHISTLYFDGKREYTKKRLQKIKAAGFVGERKRNANEQSVLFLTRKAFAFLSNQGELLEYPLFGKNSFEDRANVSDLTLRHELEIMDVKAAFHAALSQSKKFSLIGFSTWPLLYQFETSRNGYGSDTPVKPDGFINIHENDEGTKGFAHDFFLEVDRSSKTLDALIVQASRYVDYYKSGGFAVRNGGTPDRFKEYPFRVLLILKSRERRNNAAERLAYHNPPILTQVLLTTLADVVTDPLGAIWIQPRDYRQVIQETQFDLGQKPPSSAYRRQPERESFIDGTIKKLRLLE